MANIVVNSGYEIKANDGAVIASTPIKITSLPDSNVDVNGANCFFGDVLASLPKGSTSDGYALTSDAIFTITASGENVFTDKGKSLLQCDKSTTVPLVFVLGDNSKTVNVTLKITKAGQTDVDVS